MNGIFEFWQGSLPSSLFWLRLSNVVALAGIVFAAVSAFLHWRQMRAQGAGRVAGRNLGQRLALLAVTIAVVMGGWSIWNRYLEVNHFPSQTMSEVLQMFSWMLILAVLVLHYALKLGRLGFGWAIVDDAILALVLAGALATNSYTATLSTAQRDLPPALQSYWFPPHLVALIFSYATMGIAGIITLVYFATRFWSGVWSGGRTRASQFLVLAGLLLVPFAHFVTAPILVLVGLVFLALKMTGHLPAADSLDGLEKTMDQVSYRAFAVGMPFLTGGLFMGAFWAQEAWANYWGWDSKENSALISWLVYVLYIHLRMLGGYRGEKAMAVLAAGALSVFLTFQVFGYLPDSQKSLHRYTDDGVVPREGMQGAKAPAQDQSARLEDD